MSSARSASIADESSARYYGWRVVAACFVLALLSWGFGFYGHGFYLAELKRLHDWPASLIAGASTASYLFSALLVVFVNDALRRLGIAACVLFGATALAGSAAALAFVTEPWQLIAAYLVMSFGWATMSLGAINNILGLWFQQRRGLAISLALNGASFSGVVIVPSLVLVAAASGFATAMLAGAALILALAVPLAFTILRVPPPSISTAANLRAETPPCLSRRPLDQGQGAAQPRLLERVGALRDRHHLAMRLPRAPDRVSGAVDRPRHRGHGGRNHDGHGDRGPPDARHHGKLARSAHRQRTVARQPGGGARPS